MGINKQDKNLPQGWMKRPVKEIFSFLSSNSYSRNQLTYEKNKNSVLNIHYGDIHTIFSKTILDISNNSDIPAIVQTITTIKGDFLKDGDVVIADASEDYKGVGESIELLNVGQTKIVPGLHTIAVRSESNLMVNGFKAYALRHPIVRKAIKTIATGTKVYGISKSTLKDVDLFLPTRKEQQEIANILSTWDDAIDKTQQLIGQLQLRKKSLMQELLTGQKRLPGVKGEWKELALGDITKRITTKNKELNDNVVTISAQRGFVRQEDFFKKRVASSTLSGYYLINKGDFAYNKSYSNGYPMGAFKRLDNLDKAVVTTLYICFSIKDNVDSDFLLNYFEAGLLVKNLRKIAKEGGRAHGLLNIGLPDFFSLRLTLPPKEEQQAISTVLNSTASELQHWELYLKQLKDQKKGLMQQLLTGKIRIKS